MNILEGQSDEWRDRVNEREGGVDIGEERHHKEAHKANQLLAAKVLLPYEAFLTGHFLFVHNGPSLQSEDGMWSAIGCEGKKGIRRR